jgi:hypothetical protein
MIRPLRRAHGVATAMMLVLLPLLVALALASRRAELVP